LLVVGVGAAVVEEILFRGVLLRFLEELVGSWVALLVSAAAFGLIHLDNPNADWWAVTAIGIEAGLGFGVVYLATRSLWWVIGMHFAWNVVQGPLLGLPVSGENAQYVSTCALSEGWFRSALCGDPWLTGGPFGLEASPLPVGIMALLAVWLLIVLGRNQRMIAPWWTRRRLLQTAWKATAASTLSPSDQSATFAHPDDDPDATPDSSLRGSHSAR
jgi:hypothetical protein